MAIARSQHLPIAAAACSAGSGLWEWTATVIGNIQTNTSMNSPWWHQKKPQDNIRCIVSCKRVGQTLLSAIRKHMNSLAVALVSHPSHFMLFQAWAQKDKLKATLQFKQHNTMEN